METLMPMAPGSPLCRVYAERKPTDGLDILFKGGQVRGIDQFGRVLNGALWRNGRRTVTTITLMGAGGKMGCRLTDNITDHPQYEMRYVEGPE